MSEIEEVTTASDHTAVVSINIFVALLCACIVIGHILEENRWMNESITAIAIGLCTGFIILLTSGGTSSHILVFSEYLFFIYLLPPLIFNAGRKRVCQCMNAISFDRPARGKMGLSLMRKPNKQWRQWMRWRHNTPMLYRHGRDPCSRSGPQQEGEEEGACRTLPRPRCGDMSYATLQSFREELREETIREVMMPFLGDHL